MIKAFHNLSDKEYNLLLKVPALVTVLIAGADSDIDSIEIKEASSLTRLKKVTSREILTEYYDQVREIFDQQLSEIICQFPKNTQFRQYYIVQELGSINEILTRLEFKFAVQFYASIKDFAKKIAESSGGILGFIPVGYEEAKLIDLPMINYPELK